MTAKWNHTSEAEGLKEEFRVFLYFSPAKVRDMQQPHEQKQSVTYMEGEVESRKELSPNRL